MYFFRRLHQTLGPTSLLRFECVHFHRQLGGTLDVRQIKEMPAAELRAVRKVRVFGKRVVLPAAGILHRVAAPDTRSAVEIEEQTAAITRTMLDDEVSVQQNGFDFRQCGIIAIDIAPARLHHGEFSVREIGHRAAQKIRGRNKVRIEDGHKFTVRGFQAFLQRARFIAFAIVAMDVADGHSEGAVAFYTVAGDLAGLGGRIVENLNLEQLARIIELRNGFDKPFDHVPFVVNGELNSDFRPGSYLRRRPRDVLSVFIIVVNQGVAVNAVSSQYDHYEKIRQHDCKIEGIELVNAAKWVEFGVHVP